MLALTALAALAGGAGANGRPPGTSTINFRPGHEQDILAGMSFGVTVSHDGGATWHWMCEKAVKYGGMYDPDYVYNPTGAVFATTFDGSLEMRNGCTFDATPFGTKFFSTIAQGPDGALYMAAAQSANLPADPGDAKIYKSTDNGMTFPTSANPGMVNDWWSSLEVAPSDPSRVYLAGYRIINGVTAHVMFKSTNGGTSFAPLSLTGLTLNLNSRIDVVGISHTNPDLLFIRVSYQNPNAISDGIYRSTDGGGSWTKVLDKNDEIAFVVRANGDLVAGTRNSGTFQSTAASSGDVWTAVANAPHINCLVENAAGEVWACTQNFGAGQTPSDQAGIMKSTDLVTWTKVLHYQDIQGPVECAAGTIQHDQCVYDCPDAVFTANPQSCPNTVPSAWCSLKNQLGITSTVLSCPKVFDDPPAAADVTTTPPKGCCETGESSPGPAALLLGLGVGVVLLRTRRRA